jgi:hypothetical protein
MCSKAGRKRIAGMVDGVAIRWRERQTQVGRNRNDSNNKKKKKRRSSSNKASRRKGGRERKATRKYSAGQSITSDGVPLR